MQEGAFENVESIVVDDNRQLASYQVGMVDEYSFRVALKGYCRDEWLHHHSPTQTPQKLAELLLERSSSVAQNGSSYVF